MTVLKRIVGIAVVFVVMTLALALVSASSPASTPVPWPTLKAPATPNPAGSPHITFLNDIPVGQTGNIFLKIVRYDANHFNISYHSPNYYSDNIPAPVDYGMSPNYIQIGMRLSGSSGATSGQAAFTNSCYIQGGTCYPQTNPGNPANGYVSNPPYGYWSPQPAPGNSGGQWTTNVQKYNRSAAVGYADQWALSRNSYYNNYPSQDCTNFASQIMAAGGLPQLNGSVGDNNAWWFVYYTLQNSNTWSAAANLQQHFSNYNGSYFRYLTGSNMFAGDMAVFSLDGTGRPSHVRPIVGYGNSASTVGTFPIGTWGLLADQHDTDRYRVIWNDGIPAGAPNWNWQILW